ncbi:MAG: ATP-binding cassette domain-containing protein [Oligoflexales bacterium]|nr:ATP-binding cassette domain-containing protein [Oligoflexales bacterium]
MIRLEGIKKEFPLGNKTIQVLKGISVTIDKGEFVSIMGPSGSGKSTLSSILGCLATPTSGKYFLMDKDVSTMSGDALSTIRNQKIGFIFQDFNLLPGLSIVENVMLPLFYRKMSPFKAKQKALDKIEAVGLLKWANHRPNQLSGGQKQRVAIARALVSDPLFLFADEPTGALDPKTGTEIMALLQQLNSHGHTVVQVTHSLHHCKYAKRILYLEDGLITRDDVVQNPIFAGLEQRDEKDHFVDTLWDIIINDKRQLPEDFAPIYNLYNSIEHKTQTLLFAVRAFSKWNTPEARAIIQTLVEHSDWSIRAEVMRNCRFLEASFAESLCKLTFNDSNEWVRFLAINNFRTKPVASLSEDARTFIEKSLEDKDGRVRSSALAIMKGWGDQVSLALIEKSLPDTDGRVRANAIEVLEGFLSSNPHLRESIKKYLLDVHPRARTNALKSLLPYEKELITNIIKDMLDSDNSMFRTSAAWVVQFIDTHLALSLLTERLKKENEPTVQKRIIDTMQGLLKDPLSLKDLLELALQK